MYVSMLVDLLSYFWFFLHIREIFVHYFQIVTHFLYVCQSISWLTSLLKLRYYRDISRSGWDIFLKSFGDIPGMFVHWFQFILNFLYVCESVSWLTFLLKIQLNWDISSSGWDIFLNFYGHIPWMLIHLFQIILNFYLEIQISPNLLDYTCYIFKLLCFLWVTFWDLWSCSLRDR